MTVDPLSKEQHEFVRECIRRGPRNLPISELRELVKLLRAWRDAYDQGHI